MNVKTINGHIEVNENIVGGKPRIKGHRITVQNIVVWHEMLGRSVDEIATEYDLTLADVYAALAFYHDNREEVDNSIHGDEEFVKALQVKTTSKVAEKINERKD